ncbi:dihydrofolate reductase [Synechococcus sp. PCC 7336]|uniref:dihydrofolate reductase n=1 Tax=Synechococcus sp. PCC 7336 TaxID=195250 RepID=UPI00034C1F98|nr:dihydrofolate reductase [Synechococcus sp. PCC 7336]
MPKPEIIAIAALSASNRVIGKQGKVPWRLPEDLRRFRQLTLHHAAIVGRKTWEFDLEKCPLSDRHNIVVSSSLRSDTVAPHCRKFPFKLTFVTSFEAALQTVANEDKAFIIGGGSLYRQALPYCDRLELTFLEGDRTGDTFFPPYEHLIGKEFELTAIEKHAGYRFETYRRME